MHVRYTPTISELDLINPESRRYLFLHLARAKANPKRNKKRSCQPGIELLRGFRRARKQRIFGVEDS
jgi:hypothetical protein